MSTLQAISTPSTSVPNLTPKTSYVDQITLLLDQYDAKHPINKLKLRRNQLVREIKALADKLFDFQLEISSTSRIIENQSTQDLSIDTLDKTFISQEQIDYLTQLAEKDTDLTARCQAYETELEEINLEISRLEAQEAETLIYIN